jgi:hypothetical protein
MAARPAKCCPRRLWRTTLSSPPAWMLDAGSPHTAIPAAATKTVTPGRQHPAILSSVGGGDRLIK